MSYSSNTVATARRTCCSGGLPAFAPSFRTSRSGDPELDVLDFRIPGSRKCAPRNDARSVVILEPLGQFVDILRRPARHFHAEMQTHLGQHFLDLVQRLAAEVRSAQHFR